jgi:hypothetical protein
MMRIPIASFIFLIILVDLPCMLGNKKVMMKIPITLLHFYHIS